MPDTPEPAREAWMDRPFMVDQAEGTEIVEDDVFQMQVQQPYGGWEPLGALRTDRDEVTRLQAYYLNEDAKGEPDGKVRVLRRSVVWTVDEVPGDGEGQTPASDILARNDMIIQRLSGAQSADSAA